MRLLWAILLSRTGPAILFPEATQGLQPDMAIAALRRIATVLVFELGHGEV